MWVESAPCSSGGRAASKSVRGGLADLWPFLDRRSINCHSGCFSGIDASNPESSPQPSAPRKSILLISTAAARQQAEIV